MGIASIVLFFALLWGGGFTVEKILKLKPGSFLERQIMRTGIGMAALAIDAMILNLLSIPLDWRIFLVITMGYPAYHLVKHRKALLKQTSELKVKIKASDINIIIVAVIFGASLFMYASGAFSYPYLENDDPWSHASGSKYIAVEKTFAQSDFRLFQYMNPYPPTYDFIFGLMHQVEASLHWTMKFFNALIISLSSVYFYFFAKEFTGNRNKALFATTVLAATPAYLSHFIWAPALAMTMFFPAMYALEMIKHDRKWKFAAAIALGGLLVSHPTHTLTLFAIIMIYIIVKVLATKNLKSYATAAIGGIAASLTWWAPYGKSFFGSNINTGIAAEAVQQTSGGLIAKIISGLLKVFNKWSGTASRPYTFSDFFVAQGQNLINNPVGIGVVVSVLFVIGMIITPLKGIRKSSTRLGIAAALAAVFVAAAAYRNESMLALMALYAAALLVLMAITKEWKRNSYFFISLAWFLLAFLIVNNLTFDLPIGFYAFRTWMILAVPVALIAAEGLWGIFDIMTAAKMKKQTLMMAKIGVVAIVLAGIWLTSAQQKYEVNTATWPPGAFWTSGEEIGTYIWLSTLEPDTKVFSYLTDDQVIGMDKFSCGWCEAESVYRATGFDETAEQTSLWMNAHGYEYVIIGGREVRELGQERVITKMQGMASSGLFIVEYQTNGAVVFRVV